MIRTILVTVYFILLLLFVAVPYIFYSIATGRADALYRVGVRSLKILLWIGGVRVRIEGLENIPPGVCVFVANHMSNSDPPAAVVAIPRRVSLLGKKEVFKVPIVGTCLRLAGIVPVDRADRDAAAASVDEAVNHLKAGISFLVYPEGTRSPDGRLRPFKKGSFIMAIQAGVPVVPMSIAGAQKILRKGGWAIHPGEIRIRFHPAVETSGYSMDQRGELLSLVHAAVAAGLPEDQKPIERETAAS